MAKRALCVGINDYPGTGQDLSGCVNDALDWVAELKTRGYGVCQLLDAQATRAEMVRQLNELVQGAADGDDLVFTYSGHGSWLPDEDGDEKDQRDEMLCPYDIDAQQFLMDDDLAAIFDQKPKNARLFFISDSCHSGTVAKFAPAIGDAPRPRTRLLPPENFVKDKKVLEKIRTFTTALTATPTKQAYPALLMSGCKDVEYSYDAAFGGKPNGAFTYVALAALKQNPASPRAWHKLIREKLPSVNYPQTPQLFGSKKAKDGPLP
jgi:hypothetical protein